MMEPKAMCSKKIWRSGSWSTSKCPNAAKVERDGKPYCTIHDPERVAKKQAERNAKLKEEFDAKNAAGIERQRQLSRYGEAIRLLRVAVRWGGEDAEEIEQFLAAEPKP